MKKKKTSQKNTKVKNTALSHMNIYIQSFKGMNKQFGMTFLLDFAYFIALFCIIIFLFIVGYAIITPVAFAIQSIAQLFMILPASGEMSAITEQTLTQNFTAIHTFYIQALFFILGVVLLLFIITSLYKAAVWVFLTQQNHSLKYFSKFLLTSVIWQFLWLLAAVIIFILFTPGVVAALLLLELAGYLYFTPFIRLLFTEKHTVWQAYTQACIYGVKKITHFIIPFALMFITIIFGLWIYGLCVTLIPSLMLFAIPVFIFLSITWVRVYFAVVAQHVI